MFFSASIVFHVWVLLKVALCFISPLGSFFPYMTYILRVSWPSLSHQQKWCLTSVKIARIFCCKATFGSWMYYKGPTSICLHVEVLEGRNTFSHILQLLIFLQPSKGRIWIQVLRLIDDDPILHRGRYSSVSRIQTLEEHTSMFLKSLHLGINNPLPDCLNSPRLCSLIDKRRMVIYTQQLIMSIKLNSMISRLKHQ